MEFQMKLTFALFVSILLSYNLSTSFTLNGHETNEAIFNVDEADEANVDSTRVARGECILRGGCHEGYCWRICYVIPDLQGQTCNTTKGKHHDHQYVKCTQDTDCNACWRCGGTCDFYFKIPD